MMTWHGSCAIAAVPPRCGWRGAAVAAAAAATPETGTMAIVCGRIDRALQRRLGEAYAVLAAQLAAACGVGDGFAAADARGAAAAAAERAAGTGSPDGYSNTCHAQQQQHHHHHHQEDQMPFGSASEDFEIVDFESVGRTRAHTAPRTGRGVCASPSSTGRSCRILFSNTISSKRPIMQLVVYGRRGKAVRMLWGGVGWCGVASPPFVVRFTRYTSSIHNKH
jgi:hypothetical protein